MQHLHLSSKKKTKAIVKKHVTIVMWNSTGERMKDIYMYTLPHRGNVVLDKKSCHLMHSQIV